MQTSVFVLAAFGAGWALCSWACHLDLKKKLDLLAKIRREEMLLVAQRRVRRATLAFGTEMA